MTGYYFGYIYRKGYEYEVSARLYEHGKFDNWLDNLGGHNYELVDDPIFTDFVAFDEYGVELTLTPREILDSEKQMIDTYWERELDAWG